ncbi:MAG: ribosome maturation factor RimP [Candidatus Omnitrophica bacterium]|nr:ribosome maturation factor RimP [Candidatus Omnitrophota bacterium]
MENKKLVPGLESLLKEFLNVQGLDLVEMESHRAARNLVVRLSVDKPEGGITVGECSKVNRRIGDLIEEKNLIQESYIVEVNSPGLDRPLKTRQDFRRCPGRKVKFFLIEPINGKIEVDGVISGVSEDAVQICTPAGDCFIPFSQIHKAKQIF